MYIKEVMTGHVSITRIHVRNDNKLLVRTLCSNLDPETSHSDGFIVWLFSFPPGRCWGSTSDKAMTAFLKILSNSFTVHQSCCISWYFTCSEQVIKEESSKNFAYSQYEKIYGHLKLVTYR